MNSKDHAVAAPTSNRRRWQRNSAPGTAPRSLLDDLTADEVAGPRPRAAGAASSPHRMRASSSWRIRGSQNFDVGRDSIAASSPGRCRGGGRGRPIRAIWRARRCSRRPKTASAGKSAPAPAWACAASVTTSDPHRRHLVLGQLVAQSDLRRPHWRRCRVVEGGVDDTGASGLTLGSQRGGRRPGTASSRSPSRCPQFRRRG